MFIFYRWLIHTIWGIYLYFICYARGKKSNPNPFPVGRNGVPRIVASNETWKNSWVPQSFNTSRSPPCGKAVHLFCSATHLHKSSQLLGTLLKCFTIPVTNIDPENWTGRKFASYPLVSWDMEGSYFLHPFVALLEVQGETISWST